MHVQVGEQPRKREALGDGISTSTAASSQEPWSPRGLTAPSPMSAQDLNTAGEERGDMYNFPSAATISKQEWDKLRALRSTVYALRSALRYNAHLKEEKVADDIYLNFRRDWQHRTISDPLWEEAKCVEVDSRQTDAESRSSEVEISNETIEWLKIKRDNRQLGEEPGRFLFDAATGFKKKAVRILFKGKETFARPDTASDQNIITENFANEHDIPIQRGESNQSILQLGNGQYINTIGKAKVPIRVLTGISKAFREEYQWFDVLSRCPVPLILGFKFIEKFQLWTKNKHLLVDSPYTFVKIPTFKWIGTPRAFISFSANGSRLEGCADTGSDLDFMSPECAERLGLHMNTNPNARTRVMLADESIVETIGQAHASSIDIPGFDTFDMNFHILPGLSSDAIFSEEFLDQMDAFNICTQIDDVDDSYQQRLNTLVSLGPIQTFLSRTWRPNTNDSAQQVHDNGIQAEILRRNRSNRAIRKIRDNEQAEVARRAEDAERNSFDRQHETCHHCVGSNSDGQVQPDGDVV